MFPQGKSTNNKQLNKRLIKNFIEVFKNIKKAA